MLHVAPAPALPAMASAAVHPVALDDDDDDGASDDRPSAPPMPVRDLLASSSSHAWPSVSDSDSDSDNDATQTPSNREPLSRDSRSRDSSEDVVVKGQDDDDDGEILELVELGHEVCNGEDDLLEQEILENLENLENSRAESVDSDGLLLEVRAVLNEDEAETLLSDIEGESDSGSVVNGNIRVREGEYTLPDDWLRVEEDAASSSVVHDFVYTPVKTTNLGSKRVYTLPGMEAEALPEVGSQLLAWPVGVAIEIIAFQVKLIVQMASISLWLVSFSLAAFTFPFRASVMATNAAVATAVDGYALATQVKPLVSKGVTQAGPMLRRTTRKLGFGCLAAAYVMFILGSLLVPAMFLDMFLVRRIIEEPVELREVLHFDYRQVHPSATMFLLPPNVLAKVKDSIIPGRVLRSRVIPSSHKLQVTIFLTLPESHYNLELGMFQVSAELLSVRGQVLKRTSWPCMLYFQSSSIRYAKQVILGVPLLMGISRQSQTLGLRLFENEEETKTPTAMVRFIVEPKAGYPSGQGLPQIYSAEAQVVSVLPWAKDILRRWKWTFYVWNGLSLFMFEVMVVLCCCHEVLLPSKLLQGITENFGGPEVIVRETVTKRAGGKPGRRVNFSDELPTARPLMDPEKERELLLGSAESISTISGPRLRRLPTPANLGMSSDASSIWNVPHLQTLNYVGGKVEAVEESVKSFGETLVDGATDSMRKVTEVLDPKPFKSD